MTDQTAVTQPTVSVPPPEAAAQENAETITFDVPRPALTLSQAAAMLGKSLQSLERSLQGRWGNKLPDGWTARKLKTENGEEWRIIPPPGFRVRQTMRNETPAANDVESFEPVTTALVNRTRGFRPEKHVLDQPTIVIDRSEEVEHLLRELLSTQKALSEERRLHMEDMRLVAQLQGSMRLLETSASESTRLKTELESARAELEQVKREYNQLKSLPWWKRVFQ